MVVKVLGMCGRTFLNRRIYWLVIRFSQKRMKENCLRFLYKRLYGMGEGERKVGQQAQISKKERQLEM